MPRFCATTWLPGASASVARHASPWRDDRRQPLLLLAAAGLAAVALAGCGKGGSEQLSGGGPGRQLAPVAPQGAVSVATRNTTRLGGADVATDAAAVARAVYPGLTVATRPLVAVLVNEHDWLPALAASVLASAPTGAPILFSEGDTLPAVTRQTLEAMHPLGAPALGGAQVIRIGTTAPVPDGYLHATAWRSARPTVERGEHRAARAEAQRPALRARGDRAAGAAERARC